MPFGFSLTARLVLPVLWLSGPIPARVPPFALARMYRCHDCSLFPSISFGRLHGLSVRLARCSAAARFLSGCILLMRVTSNACPVLSRRNCSSGAASACRVSAPSVRLVRSRSGCAAAYASALWSGAGCQRGRPLGQTLHSVPSRCRAALWLLDTVMPGCRVAKRNGSLAGRNSPPACVALWRRLSSPICRASRCRAALWLLDTVMPGRKGFSPSRRVCPSSSVHPRRLRGSLPYRLSAALRPSGRAKPLPARGIWLNLKPPARRPILGVSVAMLLGFDLRQ